MITKLNTKKLNRKFKKQISQYQKWCKNKGYCSSDIITLLWYFNQKGKIIYIDGVNCCYCLKYNKTEMYDLADLIELFSISNNKMKSKVKDNQK